MSRQGVGEVIPQLLGLQVGGARDVQGQVGAGPGLSVRIEAGGVDWTLEGERQ